MEIDEENVVSEEEVEDEESQEDENDCSKPDIVTKYKAAGDIANAALQQVISKCAPGASIVELCTFGDNYITDATSKIYNKGKVTKGVAFPTSISVNQVVGHYSPLPEEKTVLSAGDLVKM